MGMGIHVYTIFYICDCCRSHVEKDSGGLPKKEKEERRKNERKIFKVRYVRKISCIISIQYKDTVNDWEKYISKDCFTLQDNYTKHYF